MQTSVTDRNKETGLPLPLQTWAVGAIFGAVVLAAVAVAVVNGPKFRAAEAAAIDQENRALCSRLGIGPDTSRITDCVAALTELRMSISRRNELSIL